MSLAGRLVYLAWHKPLADLKSIVAAGGPLEAWRTARGRRAMEAAALALPPPRSADSAAPVELHLLTGRRFWYQTAFCLWTFARRSGRNLAPVIYDDGSLESGQQATLARLFPRARFESRTEITARLDKHLPRTRFPVLRARADVFPLLHKILDPHAGRTGWKLLIDSDLLFFRRPALLLEWLAAPDRPLRAMDVTNAYGYPLPLLNELAGRPVDERVNTGLLGLRGEDIDWSRLESWCGELERRAGSHYYQEQALVALLLAGRSCTLTPIEDYVTYPQPPEAADCRATMHHYVADSKRWYFQRNWRQAMTDISGYGEPGATT